MAKRKNRRKSRWMSDAALQALVRFGPEESGLRAAERQALGSYESTVAGAEATRKGITQALNVVRPRVVRDYGAATTQAANARAVAAPDVANLPADSPLRAAVAAEQAGFTSRLGESRANTLTELGQRKIDAVSGAAYAKKSARETLGSDIAKLFERKQDLAREKGAFTVATAGELKRAAQQRADTLANQEANRATTRRGQTLSHKDRVASRKEAARKEREKNKAGGGARQTADKHLQVQTTIEEIANRAAKYKDLPRSTIVGKLKAGRPQQQLTVDANGDPVPANTPGAQKVTLPKIPQYAADLRMSAALDIALAGHLSKTTQQRLQRAGFSVRDLGLTTYGDWRRKQRAPGRARNKAAGGKLYGPAF